MMYAEWLNVSAKDIIIEISEINTPKPKTALARIFIHGLLQFSKEMMHCNSHSWNHKFNKIIVGNKTKTKSLFTCWSHSSGRKGNKPINRLINKIISKSNKCSKGYMPIIQVESNWDRRRQQHQIRLSI